MSKENLNVNWKEWTDPDYLTGWGLNGDQVKTIKDITKQDVTNPRTLKKEACSVMHFTEGLPMVLNKVNQKSIQLSLGTGIMSEWIGKSITIYPAKVKAFGEEVISIRVRPIAPPPPKPKQLITLTMGHEKFESAKDFVRSNREVMSFDDIVLKMSKHYKIGAPIRNELKKVYDGE